MSKTTADSRPRLPPERAEKVLAGVTDITPLSYGRYDRVAWYSSSVEGTEQYRPLSGSGPTVGKENVFEQGASMRLEFSIPRDEKLLDQVLQEGIIPAHPWEEPVIVITEARETRTMAVEEST